MEHLEFVEFHNRLISFELQGEIRKGCLLDSIPYSLKNKGTEYSFIPKDFIIFLHVMGLINGRDKAIEKFYNLRVDIREISNVKRIEDEEQERILNLISEISSSDNFKTKNPSIKDFKGIITEQEYEERYYDLKLRISDFKANELAETIKSLYDKYLNDNSELNPTHKKSLPDIIKLIKTKKYADKK